MTDVEKKIDAARENVLRLKLTVPEIFPEWQRLKAAERELEKARKELGSALAAWRRVGHPDRKKEQQ